MQDQMLWILLATCCSLVLATLIGEMLARAGFPLLSKDRRIGCIDGLRGYLALLVMVYHFTIWTQVTLEGGVWQPPQQNVLAQFGAAAVGLFFMATGFVFYPRVRAGFFACNWVVVYISRFFRLVPPIAGSLVLIVALIMARTGSHPGIHDLRPALMWLFAYAEPPLLGYAGTARINAGVLWSLHFEWIFYLLVLPICALVSDGVRRLGWPGWLVPALLLALGLGCAPVSPPTSILFYLPSFAVGMLAFECQRNAAWAERMRGRVVAVIAAVSLVAGMILFSNPYGFGLPLFALFFIAVACGNDIFGLLGTRGALVLGECSFSIYLLHGILLNVLFSEFSPWISHAGPSSAYLYLVAMIPLAVLLSSASFMFVERRAIHLGKLVARAVQSRGGRVKSMLTGVGQASSSNEL